MSFEQGVFYEFRLADVVKDCLLEPGVSLRFAGTPECLRCARIEPSARLIFNTCSGFHEI